MRSPSLLNLMKSSYLQRGVVLFLLLFALIDIMFPQYCCEEADLFAASDSAQILHLDSGQAINSTDNNKLLIQHAEQSPGEEHAEDCCFCCCTHILPTNHFFIEVTFLTVPFRSGELFSLSNSPPQRIYHPPLTI